MWVVTTDETFYPTVEYFDTYEEAKEEYEDHIKYLEKGYSACIAKIEIKYTK